MIVWKRLKTQQDYKKALSRVDEIIDLKKDAAILNELTLLSYLIEEFENTNHPMPSADPHEVIALMMEMKGIKQKDLIPILGTKGQVSRLLNGSRKLQLHQINALSKFLGIPPESLIPEIKKESSHLLTAAEQPGKYLKRLK